MTGRVYLRGVATLLMIGAAGAALHATGLGSALQDWLRLSNPLPGIRHEFVFVLVGGVLTAFGLSRQAVTFVAGYTFGVGTGALIGLLSAVLGCAAAFWVVRTLARDGVSRRLSGRLGRFNAFLRDNTFEAIVMLRFLPVGSNLLVNMLGGASQVRMAPFVAGSAVGYVPQTVVFALIGAGFAVHPDVRIALGVGLFVVSAVVGMALFRRYRRTHRHNDPGVLDPTDFPADR